MKQNLLNPLDPLTILGFSGESSMLFISARE